jgi:hypothetical protein
MACCRSLRATDRNHWQVKLIGALVDLGDHPLDRELNPSAAALYVEHTFVKSQQNHHIHAEPRSFDAVSRIWEQSQLLERWDTDDVFTRVAVRSRGVQEVAPLTHDSV